MRANSSRFPDSNFDETLDEKQFYVNGYELSVKYLGGESEFTKKFDYCLGRNRKNNSVSTPKEFKISRNRNLAALASEFLRVNFHFEAIESLMIIVMFGSGGRKKEKIEQCEFNIERN